MVSSGAMASGLSEERLARMHRVMSGHVASGQVPGLVSCLSRRGEVHLRAIGHQTLGDAAPMAPDSIFRITSMTKPITAVATMILVEECKLRLDDPVDRLLPELANRKVLKRLDGPLEETVPARRAITVRDLLTFRMGFGLIMGDQSAYPILRELKALGLSSVGPPKPATEHAPDEWMRRFGTLPLMDQPGDKWMYNTGSYVLGVLVARACGQPLEAFFQERICEPLGMKDTAFSVPPAKLDRLVTAYDAQPDPATRALVVHDGVSDSQWSRPPAFPDGGAGLVSTATDYLAFGHMMLGGGTHGGQRILSRPSVEAMTTNQLTPEQKARSGFFPGYWDNRGWGLGVSIVTGRDDVSAVPGRYGWDGGYGTSWWSDPREGLVGVLMTQRSGFPLLSNVYRDFWTSAYQAIDD